MTDSRLEQALERAAELVAELEGMGPTTESRYLAGWAEAVEALRDVHEAWANPGEYSPGLLWPEIQDVDEAIAKFRDAMLGGDDEQA